MSKYSKSQLAMIEKAKKEYIEAQKQYQDVQIEMKHPVVVENFDRRVRDWKIKRNYYLKELQHIQRVTNPVKAYFEDSILFQEAFQKMKKSAAELVIKRKIAFAKGTNRAAIEEQYQDFLDYLNGDSQFDRGAEIIQDFL